MINVNSYHHARPLRFYNDTRDTGRPLDGLLYLGAEVETDASPRTTWNSNELSGKLEGCGFLPFFDPTGDGSLSNGCEFVSYPATMKGWMSKSLMIEDGFDALLKAGLKAHQTSTCGLHIHASKNFFGESIDQRSASFGSLVTIVERNWFQFTAFARRPSTSYAKPHFGSNFGRTHRKAFRDGVVAYRNVDVNERYRSINFSKSSTVEFRFFKGTLNHQTFMATLQMIDNLCRMAKSLAPENAMDVDIYDVANFRKWPELSSYMGTLDLNKNCEATWVDSGYEE